ncbi:hypothetical protein RRG08_026104 [Elysia crispata]|uniref:Uncharacterized protein n=1 Tax=Elysia crispata TaxID=231223 RepID=A0AAE1D3A9_9GAST|nr:hypothetical protein RRG08_026104 [Elysia crispata]
MKDEEDENGEDVDKVDGDGNDHENNDLPRECPEPPRDVDVLVDSHSVLKAFTACQAAGESPGRGGGKHAWNACGGGGPGGSLGQCLLSHVKKHDYSTRSVDVTPAGFSLICERCRFYESKHRRHGNTSWPQILRN